MMDMACVVIAKGSVERRQLLDERILPAVLGQGFREVVVVGCHHEGDGYRYLLVPPVTETTVDALIKRGVGAEATSAEVVLYLSDDHAPLGVWATEWPLWAPARWDVLVPARYTTVEGFGLTEINNGLDTRFPEAPYCGGHAGIFRRRVLRAHPWMAAPHNLFWDLYHSRQILHGGFLMTHCADLRVEDVDPNPAEKPRHFSLPVAKRLNLA